MTEARNVVRRNKLMLRWSVATAGLIAAYWLGFWVLNGYVPAVTGVSLTENWSVDFPYSVSRLWDILMGPLLVFLLLIQVKCDHELKELSFENFLGLNAIFAICGCLVSFITMRDGVGAIPIAAFANTFGLLMLTIAFGFEGQTSRSPTQRELEAELDTFESPFHRMAFLGLTIGSALFVGILRGLLVGLVGGLMWGLGELVVKSAKPYVKCFVVWLKAES
jgi:hypothetical protein